MVRRSLPLVKPAKYLITVNDYKSVQLFIVQHQVEEFKMTNAAGKEVYLPTCSSLLFAFVMPPTFLASLCDCCHCWALIVYVADGPNFGMAPTAADLDI